MLSEGKLQFIIVWLKRSQEGRGQRRGGSNTHGCLGKIILSSGNWPCKGPEVRTCPHYGSCPFTMLPLTTVSITPQSTPVWKYWRENARNRQFISFELCTILISIMGTHTVPLCVAPAWPFCPASTCCTHSLPVGPLVAISVISTTVVVP